MKTLQKAKELGMLIAQSEELKELKEVEELVNEDEKASKLIACYRQMEIDAFEALIKRKSDDEIKQANEKLAQKEKEIDEYDVTKNYFESKKKFDELRKKANELVMESQELKMLQESEALVNQDEKALALVVEYRQIKINIIKSKIQRKPKEEIEQLEKALVQKKKEINE